MKEMFAERKINCNLRVTNNVYAHKPRTTAYGLENISSLGKNLRKDIAFKGVPFCRSCKCILYINGIFRIA